MRSASNPEEERERGGELLVAEYGDRRSAELLKTAGF